MDRSGKEGAGHRQDTSDSGANESDLLQRGISKGRDQKGGRSPMEIAGYHSYLAGNEGNLKSRQEAEKRGEVAGEGLNEKRWWTKKVTRKGKVKDPPGKMKKFPAATGTGEDPPC